MTDFRSIKQAMYSTPMEVRSLYGAFERSVDDEGGVTVEQQITDRQIESHINNADSIIYGYLFSIYGDTVINGLTPYFLGPTTPKDNTSAVSLAGVIVASTAITEQWVVKFTAQNAFSLTGSVSGAQGTGTIGADFTSTNGDIQIKSADWSLGGDAAVDPGNQVIFSTNKAHRLVRTMSAKLACADLISSTYQSAKGEDHEYAKQMRKEVIDLLKQLADEKSLVSLSTAEVSDPQPQSVQWNINKMGEDVTVYGSYTDDVNPTEI